MRTRFLAAAVTAVTDPVETPDFYHLPLPHLNPPRCSSFSANSAHSFDEIPFFGVSREIDKLPIDDALSIFLADVVPHFVCDADIQQPQIDSYTERYEVNYIFWWLISFALPLFSSFVWSFMLMLSYMWKRWWFEVQCQVIDEVYLSL